MKKATILFLVSIFIFNSVGYFIVFKTLQYQAKKEARSIIKNNLAAEQLTTLIINRSDLKKIVWMEEGKEFSYNGNIYDVVQFSETEEAVIYSCIDDEKEEQLFENLDEQVDAQVAVNTSSKNDYAKKTIKNILDDYCFNISKITFNRSGQMIFYLYQQCKLFQDHFSSIFIPPPEESLS